MPRHHLLTVLAELEAAATRSPEKTALVDDSAGCSYDYAALLARSRELGRRLHELGVGAGDRVAVLANNRAETIFLLFACAERGAILAPLNHRLALPELETVLADCSPKLLLYGREFAETAAALAIPGLTPLPIGGLAESGSDMKLCKYSGDNLHNFMSDPEVPVLILYTSGTTGAPKGVVLSRGMILANARQTREGWGLNHDDATVTCAPLFHTGGWNVLTLPLLLAGGTVDLHERFDARAVAEAAARGRATVLFGVPTMYQMLLEHKALLASPSSRLRFVISGGAPCPKPVISEYLASGINFRQGFGMTEAGPNCFCFPPSAVEEKMGSVGMTMPGTRMRLMDGELQIAGPHLFSGYWNRPTETGETLADGWVRTGDLAERDEDGFWWILGRRKDMFISGGENVYPAEVEQVLAAHPAVAEAAVIGVADARWQEVGMAFVVPRPGHALDAELLRRFCDGRLARYKQPKAYEFLDALPKNAVGKVQKRELATRAACRP